MKTKNGLMNGVKTSMTQPLATLLADIHQLYIKTLGFHWNVEDPRFSQLHALFEDNYLQLAKNLDEIAERIRKLGKFAPGTVEQLTNLRRLQDADSSLTGNQMIEALANDFESLVVWIREDITLAEQLKDYGTSDTLIILLKQFEKQAWILRSHL